MNTRAFLKYYLDVNLFNLVFSLLISFINGFFWGIIIFCSLGIFIGRLGYKYFKENEYYMYHNLGFTKPKLLRNVLIFNLILSIPVIIILSIV